MLTANSHIYDKICTSMLVNNKEKKVLILAPMAGVTDKVMRRLCAEYGADLAVTEMVSAAAVYYGDKKTFVLADISEDICPCAIQIFGSDPDKMAYAAAKLTDTATPPAAIDINMGCPVKKIVSNGEGSALMDNISLAARIVESVVKASKVPVTVKMRTGRSPDSITAPALARAVEESGASAVCIHGRTRSQLYEPGCVEHDTTAYIKTLVKIPVIANGDIDSGQEAVRVLQYTKADGVAIGRGAFGAPYVFSRIGAYLDGEEYTEPSDEEKISMGLHHLRLLCEDKGHMGLLESRKHLCRYLKGIPGAAEARVLINTAPTPERAEEILKELLSNVTGFSGQ